MKRDGRLEIRTVLSIPRAFRRGSSVGFSFVFALSAVVALGGCGTKKSPTEPTDPPDSSATFSRVQAEIFTPSCARPGCHAGGAPQARMNLSAGQAYGQIVGIKSTESSRVRIAPGAPSASYLLSKIAGDATITGSRMPLGGPFLSTDKGKLLTDWVRRGSPND